MESKDLIFTLIRASSALASALAGIAALLTDGAFTKREPPPVGRWKDFPFAKYRATPWGGALLAVILAAPAAQFVGDLMKDARDAKTFEETIDAIRAMNEGVKDSTGKIHEDVVASSDKFMNEQTTNSARTSEVAKKLDRITNPLLMSDVRISYSLRASLDAPEFADYRQRLERGLAGIPRAGAGPGQTEFRRNDGSAVIQVNSPLLPLKGEEIPFYVLRCTGIGLMFYVKEASDLAKAPDLSLVAELGPEPSWPGAHLSHFIYDDKTHVMEITGILIPPHKSPSTDETGLINAIPDLAGSQLAVMLMDYAPTIAAQKEISAIRDRLQLLAVSMKVKNRVFLLGTGAQMQRHRFPHTRVGYNSSMMGYLTTLPQDIAKLEQHN